MTLCQILPVLKKKKERKKEKKNVIDLFKRNGKSFINFSALLLFVNSCFSFILIFSFLPDYFRFLQSMHPSVFFFFFFCSFFLSFFYLLTQMISKDFSRLMLLRSHVSTNMCWSTRQIYIYIYIYINKKKR